jgi:hypothetical protein
MPSLGCANSEKTSAEQQGDNFSSCFSCRAWCSVSFCDDPSKPQKAGRSECQGKILTLSPSMSLIVATVMMSLKLRSTASTFMPFVKKSGRPLLSTTGSGSNPYSLRGSSVGGDSDSSSTTDSGPKARGKEAPETMSLLGGALVGGGAMGFEARLTWKLKSQKCPQPLSRHQTGGCLCRRQT